MQTHRADTPSDCSAANANASEDGCSPEVKPMSQAEKDDAEGPGVVPVIMLRGKWLHRIGFSRRCLIKVQARDGAILLTPAGSRSKPRFAAPDDFDTQPGYTVLEDPHVTQAALDTELRCRFRAAAWRVNKTPSLLLRLLMQRYVDVDEDRFSLSLALWGTPERRAATMVARELVPPNEELRSVPRWW